MIVREVFLTPARRVGLGLVFLCAALLAGCATPDLKPFAEASKTLSTSVNTGGDLAIKPLTRERHWDGANAKFIAPSDASHPSHALEKSWELRRNTMDAVLVYSASLAAIGEASANRKQNATELVGSVKSLVSAVPGLSLGTSAVGDLLVFGLQTVVEVKAFNDMKRAVESANTAIQLVAQMLNKDFAALSDLFETKQLDLVDASRVALVPLNRANDAVRKQIATQRTAVEKSPSDPGAGAELVRLGNVLAALQPDLTRLRADRATAEQRLQEGKEFFNGAIKAVDAWAAAHADLGKAFAENRTPNLVLLTARAQELKEIVDKLKK